MRGGTKARSEEFKTYAAARRSYLRRVAYLVCGSWDNAEDLVQIALLKLYKAWPRIHRAGAEDAYARKTILRTHLDESRRPWRREVGGLEGFDEPARATLPYEEVDALITALKALPEGQRKTVVLRFWCDLSIEETAFDLGCTKGTVKSQTSRAVASLRAALSPDDRAEDQPFERPKPERRL